ncbi:hypothetical protein ACFOSC_13510 [Streptantibioticus rubrisoli]|uniref:Uncharacterized protein n=1 Tax=Streptantibioticus rubrisoli TaxID=1387313 RepID=A0ABT1PF02_9ACTN|nr:hypothetical protein [Streptantibioticus rubrisoli]MCQ4043053.1 hypothetical protein [Streptantibioticus rubrisoli]
MTNPHPEMVGGSTLDAPSADATVKIWATQVAPSLTDAPTGGASVEIRVSPDIHGRMQVPARSTRRLIEMIGYVVVPTGGALLMVNEGHNVMPWWSTFSLALAILALPAVNRLAVISRTRKRRSKKV